MKKLTIEDQLNKTMKMPAWPSDKKYQFRCSTGEYDLYYADSALCHTDDYICSKKAFEANKELTKKKVYSVAQGKITVYELVKKTPCFYKVNTAHGVQSFSVEGNSISHRLGGRSTVTTDILKASEAAQAQINTITDYLQGRYNNLKEAEDQLKAFLTEHTQKELIAYQVGENDVVVAYNEQEAIDVLVGYGDLVSSDFSLEDVTDLTSKLNEILKDEEGNDIETLGDWVKRIEKPEYLYGWE